MMMAFAALRCASASLRSRLLTHHISNQKSIDLLRSQARTVSSLSSATTGGNAEAFRGATPTAAAAVAALALLAAAGGVTLNEGTVTPHPGAHPMPAAAGQDNICDDAPSLEELPIYRSSEVAENDGRDGKPIWMSYGGVVYDVTGFIPNHPGGSEKILLASGGALEPWWYLYRQHFASDLPMRMMEKMIVGRLDENDQAAIDAQMEKEIERDEDPYENEPVRHPKLKVHSDQPMNAEVPAQLITASYLTPSDLFYIRHHHPVPLLTDDEVRDYSIDIDLSAYGKGTLELSLDDLKKMDKVEITSTMQCSGNRRGGFNEVGDRTSGTPWGQGAVSTAKWSGVRLKDVLKLAGLDDPIAAEEKGYENVRFESLDGMTASIGIEKACNPYGDTILAYEMNGEPIPRDHGFPLRVIVPGYSAVRNVKWVSRIELSKEEAEGPWQRGLNYKMLPPAVRDAAAVNLDSMPSMMESSLYSGITEVGPSDAGEDDDVPLKAGDKVMAKATGWAWAGGGRNVVRVDVTGDGGKTWTTAEVTEGGNQKFGRAWAWVFWTADVPAVIGEDGKIELASKAVDFAFNHQPESCAHSWNVRGLGNNAWYKMSTAVL